MKQFLSLPALLALTLVPAYAQEAPDFGSADTDRDGMLSVQEAQVAFPDLIIVDSNGDGMLNQDEVEAAVPGLTFSPDGAPAEEGATVGEAEYQRIVQAVEAQAAGRGV